MQLNICSKWKVLDSLILLQKCCYFSIRGSQNIEIFQCHFPIQIGMLWSLYTKLSTRMSQQLHVRVHSESTQLLCTLQC